MLLLEILLFIINANILNSYHCTHLSCFSVFLTKFFVSVFVFNVLWYNTDQVFVFNIVSLRGNYLFMVLQ